MKHYAITTLNPRPSMNVTTTQIRVATYAEAVEIARRFWRITGAPTTLYDSRPNGVHGSYPWHRIERDGSFIDKNTNSGVPVSGQI